MKALTVRQPWAWALVYAGKSPENRTRNIAGSYRGPLAIHAGLVEDEAAYDDEMIRQEFGHYDDGWLLAEQVGTLGAFVGVGDLVDVHPAHDRCCGRSGWAEADAIHLRVTNPRPLADPIPCRGHLGLWTPPPAVLEQLQAVV